MAFYLDSADRAALTRLWPSGVFAGVTTNPTILSRAGLSQRDLPELYDWLSELGVPEIFMQVQGTQVSQMAASAAQLRAMGPVVVKVPATTAGLRVARDLVDDGCSVLVTAVYHPVQALLARDVGADWVAPYVGRMSDAGRPGVQAVIQMQQAISAGGTQILAASLRSADQVAELAAAGVPHFTVGESVAAQMLEDELTQAAVAEFEEAAAGPAAR